jgi:hypothetical protein
VGFGRFHTTIEIFVLFSRVVRVDKIDDVAAFETK